MSDKDAITELMYWSSYEDEDYLDSHQKLFEAVRIAIRALYDRHSWINVYEDYPEEREKVVLRDEAGNTGFGWIEYVDGDPMWFICEDESPNLLWPISDWMPLRGIKNTYIEDGEQSEEENWDDL